MVDIGGIHLLDAREPDFPAAEVKGGGRWGVTKKRSSGAKLTLTSSLKFNCLTAPPPAVLAIKVIYIQGHRSKISSEGLSRLGVTIFGRGSIWAWSIKFMLVLLRSR